MKMVKILNSVLALGLVFGLVAIGVPSSGTQASSHREAPLITADPYADNTDVYAFRSPDNQNTVTIIGNWSPFEKADSGPNFYRFGDDVIYEINLDTQGLARANKTWRFDFRTIVRNPDTFLYNTNQVTSLDDPDLNVRQVMDVIQINRTFNANGSFASGNSQVLASNVPVAPWNIGPRSTPNYEANLAVPAIRPLAGGGQVFAGPRDDPFFVDLGSAFDLLGLRPLNPAHLIPLAAENGVDGVAGYNVQSIAIQVPIANLGSQNGVVGVWATAKRPMTRVLNDFTGTWTESGRLVQVSRLGMPLVNEVIVPVGSKDRFNGSRPDQDGQFGAKVLSPEPTGLMNLLYPPLIDTQTTNRNDIAAIFLTGIPTVNQLPIVTASEMIRLNTGIAVTAAPKRLGVLEGDFQGFPNGRRLTDDVVDIELQALACAYGAAAPTVFQLTGNCDPAVYNKAPNNALSDGVNANEKPLKGSFPYMAEPYQGYEADPPTPRAAQAAALGLGTVLVGFGIAAFTFRRRGITFRKQTVKETNEV